MKSLTKVVPLRLVPIFFALLCFSGAIGAEEINNLIKMFDQAKNQPVASETSLFLFLSSLSLIPVAIISLTSFTRIIIVLSMLRYAFGMQQTPPNIVLIVLSLFFTLFVMQPTLSEIEQNAYRPYSQQKIDMLEAVEVGGKSIKQFMIKQTREKDLQLIIDMSKAKQPESIDEVRMLDLIPAFLLSELRSAFQIAFVLFIPFLMIDLIVAGSLMSLGMIMVPPMTIAMPLKILIFVLVDGWALVTQSLLSSFNVF